MFRLGQSFEVIIEEGGVITLPDEVLLHLGIPPGQETQLEAEFAPNGSLVVTRVSAHDRF